MQIEMLQISSGCGPIGGNFGKLESLTSELIATALLNGINLIDTGYWYGQTRSEQILGKVHGFTKFP